MEELDKLLRTREHYETLLFDKDERIAELEQELAKYKELQDQLGLENADEFEWFVMLDLLTDNEKNMHILDLHRELAELKERAIVPRFRIGQTLYMIPTLFNSLKHITEYELLRLTLSDIGIRYELSIKNKEKGIEPYYCASEDMFDISIFTTEQEAQDKLKEIQGNE